MFVIIVGKLYRLKETLVEVAKPFLKRFAVTVGRKTPVQVNPFVVNRDGVTVNLAIAVKAWSWVKVLKEPNPFLAVPNLSLWSIFTPSYRSEVWRNFVDISDTLFNIVLLWVVGKVGTNRHREKDEVMQYRVHLFLHLTVVAVSVSE